jgi:hypothetical protein
MRKDAKNKNIQDYVTCNFGLEVVFQSALLFDKPMFYKRKLAVFNFTVCALLRKRKGIVNFAMKHEVNGGLMRSAPAWKHSGLIHEGANNVVVY